MVLREQAADEVLDRFDSECVEELLGDAKPTESRIPSIQLDDGCEKEFPVKGEAVRELTSESASYASQFDAGTLLRVATICRGAIRIDCVPFANGRLGLRRPINICGASGTGLARRYLAAWVAIFGIAIRAGLGATGSCRQHTRRFHDVASTNCVRARSTERTVPPDQNGPGPGSFGSSEGAACMA